MPADYRIDQERRAVFTRVWGEFTQADVVDHRTRLRADPAFDPTFRQLADFLGVTKLALTAQEIREISQDDPWDPSARRALVASGDLEYGSARMYELLLGANVAVFRTVEEAEEWLGL